MSGLKLLFIEDEPESVEPVTRLLNKIGGYDWKVVSFADEEAEIEATDPDVVILDLVENGRLPERETPGLLVFDRIWQQRFRPIVVYSAWPEVLDEHHGATHPFIKAVKKGKGSPARVRNAIEEFRPQVEAVRGAEQHICQQFAFALRDVASVAFRVFGDPSDFEKRNDIITRAGRRRLAALMDELTSRGQVLASWEIYLAPPVSKDIRLGDVLRKKGYTVNEPASYCVVLTPSCDLDTSGGRSPKVEHVLTAHCCSFKQGIQSTGLPEMKARKFQEKLRSLILTPGYFENIVPLPALPGMFPHMTVNLRDLEFIPLRLITGSEETAFEVIASVDSPFRELFAWAYMRIACRPGLPDRDFDTWEAEIMEGYRRNNKGKG